MCTEKTVLYRPNYNERRQNPYNESTFENNNDLMLEFRINSLPISLSDDVIPYLIRDNYQNQINTDIVIVASYPAAYQDNKKNIIAKGPVNTVKRILEKKLYTYASQHLPSLEDHTPKSMYELLDVLPYETPMSKRTSV